MCRSHIYNQMEGILYCLIVSRMIFLIDLQYYKIFTVTLYENYIQFIYKYDL